MNAVADGRGDARARKSRMSPGIPGLLGLGLGLVGGWVRPWPIAGKGPVMAAGVIAAVLVAVISVWSARAFRRHGTPESPFKETTALVDTGPFRFSRNPGYIALALLLATLGLLLNNAWILLTIAPVMVVIDRMIVLREEGYLEARFGGAYLAYKSRVRRWI